MESVVLGRQLHGRKTERAESIEQFLCEYSTLHQEKYSTDSI